MQSSVDGEIISNRAHGILVSYRVRKFGDRKWEAIVDPNDDCSYELGTFATLTEAKAQCQLHHDEEVLGIIEHYIDVKGADDETE